MANGARRFSHFSFDDDSLVFDKATKEVLRGIWNILRIYEGALGHMVNFDKSKLVLNPNVPIETRDGMTRILNVRLCLKLEKYLGMLTVVVRLKIEVFQGIRARFGKSLLGWIEKCLSKVGKEVLIKVVLQSSYITMSCFRLPDTYYENFNH
ncbi:UNVERIFIED_CONTAM: hypothetical protein Sradi_4035300 [Sesamum radiatum]|uniref:Reverse transcriptase domain-containing protein n=1 Tax=Sesamum radiatum TaxID=300843 RepID=A0AAW2PLW3_SESRA